MSGTSCFFLEIDYMLAALILPVKGMRIIGPERCRTSVDSGSESGGE
jgi:hypothetical protein